MGLIARRLERRSAQDFLSDTWDDEHLWGDSRETSSGIRVNRQTALSLSTIWRCTSLLSSAIAQAPKDVFVKIGGQSFLEYRSRPGWLTMPDPTNPGYSINDHFAQVALSILFDGNFFTEAYPSVLDPQALISHDPARVDIRSGPEYDIKDANGRVVRTIGPMQMLHGTWMRPSGSLRGLAPLEVLRRGIGSAVAAEDFASRFFGQGAAMSFGVEVPGKLTAEKKAELAEALKKRYAGLRNSHAIGVLSDGGKFVTGLAPTPEQAQMLATRKFSVEDLSRIYGVPPGMSGSQEPGASSYASAETYHQEFRDYAVLPLAVIIESPYNRLLTIPDSVNDPGASVQFKFNLDHIARTNLLSRYQAHREGVQGGFITPNEARGFEDLPPHDGGDQLYLQSQNVPITQLGLVPAGGRP